MATRHLAAVGALVPALLGPALPGLAPGPAAAAELGRLTLQSGVGEPLRAEIEIRALAPGEAATLAARIPPPEVFWRANLEPSPALDRVRVAVERRPGNRYVVALRSGEPFEEPFVQLLVELQSAAGRAVREYPFLLEEPRRGARAVASPWTPEEEAPAGRAAPPAPASQPSPHPDGYLVKPGDTLATIAQGRRYAGATIDQALVAIYRANEQAFEAGSVNRLRAGATLALPGAEAVLAIDPEEARQFVLAQSAPQAAPRAEAPAPRAQSPAAAPERDRLRVARAEAPKAGAAANAREDDLASLQRAFAESKERIGLLEKSLDDVRVLLAMKDQQLARMVRNGHAGASVGDAAASAAVPGEADPRGALAGFLDHYGGWLVLGFVVGFVSWVLRPLKTVSLWRKKRRRRMRDLRKHARRVRRAAREAGLLSTSS